LECLVAPVEAIILAKWIRTKGTWHVRVVLGYRGLWVQGADCKSRSWLITISRVRPAILCVFGIFGLLRSIICHGAAVKRPITTVRGLSKDIVASIGRGSNSTNKDASSSEDGKDQERREGEERTAALEHLDSSDLLLVTTPCPTT
jgi:hypothetical protein